MVLASAHTHRQTHTTTKQDYDYSYHVPMPTSDQPPKHVKAITGMYDSGITVPRSLCSAPHSVFFATPAALSAGRT